MSRQEAFWLEYYARVAEAGNPWLDYSNDRVQAQTFGLALDSAGPVHGKRCLDVGCGRGQFCRALSALGASSVTGVDIVPEVIATLERESSQIRWLCGSPDNPELVEQLETYEIVFLLEVLQYIRFPDALRAVWQRLQPGGRLVAVAPNPNCAIVSRTRDRFSAWYSPPTLAAIHSEVSAWMDLEHLAYRALSFARDQRTAPYEVSPWLTSGAWNGLEPNRIQFVAIKRASDAVGVNGSYAS
jgi:2-polyprenyl-3-methyl-5-hydroxy-6-metoxy-1,4-benzoquinol methylase